METIKKYVHSGMMKPRGTTVQVHRDIMSFSLTLDGRDDIQTEISRYTTANPGVLKVTDENGQILWASAEEMPIYRLEDHDDCPGCRICDKGYYG